MMSGHFSAAVPNLRIMETDIDRIPWDDDLFTAAPDIRDGHLYLPDTPGLGHRAGRGRTCQASAQTAPPQAASTRGHARPSPGLFLSVASRGRVIELAHRRPAWMVVCATMLGRLRVPSSDWHGSSETGLRGHLTVCRACAIKIDHNLSAWTRRWSWWWVDCARLKAAEDPQEYGLALRMPPLCRAKKAHFVQKR